MMGTVTQIRFLWIMAIAVCFVTDGVTAPDSDTFFEKKVRPILIEKCISCHGSENPKGNLRLDSRNAILEGGDRGAAVVPNKPDQSLFIRVLGHDDEIKMPPKNKLPDMEIAILKEWVRLGVPWPNTTIATKSTAPKMELPISAEERAFWAFQPINLPQIPDIRNSQQEIRNPIDSFLLAKMAEKGLTYSSPADKRILLRRVTFDLTGLPPTPEEIDNFLKEQSPDAYSRLVERLLASPAYGEKWGRRWLDIARYADSNGMDENLAYIHAWRYRDWVIKSLNADKPYDEFVREQIAGDLFPSKNDSERAERLTATGFLVIGPKMLAEDDPMKMRMDIIDEQLDTIGQAFMGLTFGCARCHDHKFDPIRMSDYYGLAGIFYSTKTMRNHSVVAVWHERPIGTSESIAALAEYEKQLAKLREEIASAEKQVRSIVETKLVEERNRSKEYLEVATKVHRRRGKLKLVSENPDKIPGNLLVESEAYSRGNVLKLKDGYGEGIGVIINAGPMPNYTEYDIEIPQSATYQLAVRYTAAESRPTRIIVNNKVVAGEACGSITGSWFPNKQGWSAEAIVPLNKGKSTIRFERDGPFPHLDKFVLLPLTDEQLASAPLTVEQAAKDRKLLISVLRQWVEVVEKQNGKSLVGEELEKIINRKNGAFRISPELEAEISPSNGADLKRLREKLTSLEKAKPPVDEVMAVEDAQGENLRIHLRGNHLTLGVEAPRRFPKIISGDTSLTLSKEKSGRLEFANWLTNPKHPLTARIMVNRIWAGHFGVGLVRSVDNFGRLGERPTHPELLDWLASEFIRSGWSIKQIHRLIVLSTAYQMSSNAENPPTDPDNRLLSHFNRRRLDAEEIRDGMLSLSGLLDPQMGGSQLNLAPRQYVTSTANRNFESYSQNRRSIYLPIIRSAVFDVLQTLDFPDPSVPNGQRSSTTVPAQALLMLNSALVDSSSQALAKSVLGSENGDRISEAYRRIFGRSPTSGEREKIVSYLSKSESLADPKMSPEKKKEQAWRGLCRVLLESNEFVFVE